MPLDADARESLNIALILFLSFQTQKLLFSATLTRDPARVAALQLNKPIYLAVTSKRGKSSTAANEQIEGSEAIEDGEGDTLHKLLDDERQFVLPETLRVGEQLSR